MVGPAAFRYPEKHPRCFLHVAKSGGTSVYHALVAALPAGSVSVYEDTSNLRDASTAFNELGDETRVTLLVDERELDALPQSAVLFGHLNLPMLLRIAPLDSIATIFREPRSRVLSLYTWARLTPGLYEAYTYRPDIHARRPLDEYLSEPEMAPEIDNPVCRMLLDGDPRIPVFGFISPEHVESLASDAIDLLDRFGFVGVLERESATWEGLSRFFDVTLEPTRENVTASAGVAADALPIQQPISDRTLDLLHARTASDALVYRQALMADSTEAEAKQISDAAWAAQLVRLGDVGGRSAASAQSLTRELNARRETISFLEAELARHRGWLDGIQGSVSWQITKPLRAAKRRVLKAKST